MFIPPVSTFQKQTLGGAVHLYKEELISSKESRSMTTVLETSLISPPPGAAAMTVPQSFFDIVWVHFHPIRRLLFYDYPCSKPQFLDTIVPQLKQSLSLTLQDYLPVAGKLLVPSDSQKLPLIRYVAGDSVSLTIAESGSDFDELVGNHARDSDQFYDFVPEMPPVEDESDCKLVHLMALKVTLFPGRGICLGFANHHSLGDASSIVGFMSAWAEISKHGHCQSIPIFDRSVLQDSTHEADAKFWKVIGQIPLKPSPSFPVPTNRVRATFVLTQPNINKLKESVLEKKPSLAHVSTFVVTTAYVWTCLVKSEEDADDSETEVFFFPANARGRLNCLINPPVPVNYFGNCLGGGMVSIEHGKVAGDEGFVIAAEAIAEQIRDRVNNKDEFLKGAGDWISEMAKFKGIKSVGVSGSPKFDLGNADFGWGKARKVEVISMDGEKYSMSMCKSREFQGGLEIGLSLPKQRMEAFADFFAQGLTS